MNPEPRKRLQKKAAALLARHAYSRGEIRRKLLKTADASSVEFVLNRLEKLKLLNDREYAYNFALSRVGRDGWGPEKIRRALQNRRVSASDISSALDQIRSLVGDDYALADYLKKYFGKKGTPENLGDLRNLVTHLRRRGYHKTGIIGVLKETMPEEWMRYFDTGD